MRTAAACLLLACAGCAATRAPVPASVATDAEARGVIQAAQRLFDAMEARDSTALQGILHPEARIIGVGPGGEVRAHGDGVAAWIRGVARSAEPLRERMWAPRVEVAGSLATLVAPYDFHVGARFSHCGTDAFQFVREGSGWRLLVATFTVQTEGCAPAPGPER